MSTHLEQITSRTLLSVIERKKTADFARLEQQAAARKPRGFAAELRRVATTGPAVIAEMKKASPSKGLLRAEYHPVALGRSYQAVGAAAISVLTDEPFFKGSLEDLAAVHDAVTIPVLCKDFILEPFQILEACAAGADAILLIVASHTDRMLRELAAAARSLGLDVLCEVHDRAELDRAIDLGFEVIGVNSRDLKTLQVNLQVHTELVEAMPQQVLRVAESGIRTAADVERLLEAGFDAFLVGESLMRQPDPAAHLALLMGRDYASES